MARNTNPLTKSLLIKQNWKSILPPLPTKGFKGSSKNQDDAFWSSSYGSNDIVLNNYLKTIINGTFLKLGILTSEVYISKNCFGDITLYFYYYILGNNKNKLLPILNIIKSLFNLKYPNNTLKLVCIKAPHKFVDSKLLNDYLFNNVFQEPNKLKRVLTLLIKEYKILSPKNKI